MKIAERFLYEPRYFDMLVSSTGQLSGINRRNRIIEIGLKNIWLAARCTNTSIYKDPIVIDWIIKRCTALYSKFHDLQALVALLEMREVKIIAIILDLPISKKHVLKTIADILLKNNASMSDTFSAISKLVTKELSIQLFNRLLELGYVLDDRAYNVLISKSETEEEANRITEQMRSTGVEATSNTYYQLILKMRSHEQLFETFDKFIEVVDYSSEIRKIRTVYDKVFLYCNDMLKIQSIYDDYLSRLPSPEFFSVDVYSSYFSKVIKYAVSFDDASAMYYDYYNKYIVPFISIKKSGYQWVSIIKVSKAFLDYAIDHPIDFLLFKKLLEGVLPLFKDNQYSIKSNYNFNSSFSSFYKLKYTMQQKRELIELVLSFKIKLLPKSFNGFLNNIITEEDFVFLSSRCDFESIDPKTITSIINKANPPLALLFFQTLKAKGYSLNVYIYNAIIKKLPFEECIKMFKAINDDKITPDIYSIQPLLRKWDSIDQFVMVVRIAKKNNIVPDQKVINTIVYRVKDLSIIDEFIEYYYMSFHNSKDDNSWENAICKVCNLLMRTI